MKINQILSFILLVFISFKNYSQQNEFQKAYEQKIIEIINYNDTVKTLRNEITTLNLKFDLIKKSLDDEIKSLKKDLNSVKDLKNKKILDDSVKILNKGITNYIKKIDSIQEIKNREIITLNNSISILSTERDGLKSQFNINNSKYDKLIELFLKKYNQSENIINNYSLETIQNDSSICVSLLKDQTALYENIKNWLVIKRGQVLLTKKISKSEIQDYLLRISNLPPLTVKNQLINDLSSYENKIEIVNQLIYVLEKINLEKVKGTHKSIVDEKMNLVFTTIYFESQSIDLTKYTYLNQVVKKIYNIKENDIDASVLEVKKYL